MWKCGNYIPEQYTDCYYEDDRCNLYTAIRIIHALPIPDVLVAATMMMEIMKMM